MVDALNRGKCDSRLSVDEVSHHSERKPSTEAANQTPEQSEWPFDGISFKSFLMY